MGIASEARVVLGADDVVCTARLPDEKGALEITLSS